MPTKPNYGGGQQPYVPQGNGDPSGEYADQEGGNVNFKVFTKPQAKPSAPGGSAVAPEKPSAPAPQKKPAKKIDASMAFSDFLDRSLQPEDFNKRMKEFFDAGTPEGKAFLAKTVEDSGVMIENTRRNTCFVPSDNNVLFNKNDHAMDGEPGDYRKLGQTLYHEMGHAADYFYTEQIGTYASSSIQLSSGKTMSQVLKESVPRGKRRDFFYKLEKAKADREKELIDADPIAKQYNELQSSITETRMKSYGAMDEKYESEIAGLYNKMADFQKANPEWTKHVSGAYAKAAQEFGDVSDMCEAMTGTSLLCGSHGGAYWRKFPENQGTEFFAECCAAEATNPGSLANIKKYFPDGYKAYKELRGMMESGLIKKKASPFSLHFGGR